MCAVDQFTSMDLAKIVDDLWRWVVGAGFGSEVPAPRRTLEPGPEGDGEFVVPAP
jgi:hypothetical protein